MRRVKRSTKKADAIITADIEIRNHAPICRTDDYWETFKRKMKWLKELQEKHNCPILDGGDLFDKKYKQHPSHELVRWAGYNLPHPFLTVPGNHDLPGKSYKNYTGSAMAVLEMANKVYHYSGGYLMYSNDFKTGVFIAGFEWDCPIQQRDDYSNIDAPKIALVHTMVYKKNEPFPGCEGYKAKKLMQLLPNFDLIVCGHHHQTFTHQIGNRILVNPGSLLRNDADQIDHKPCIFLWYAKTNTVKKVYVPIEEGVITRDHIDQKKQKDIRLDAFVEKLGEQTVKGIDFESNLEINTAKLNPNINDKVWQYFEGE